MFVNPLLPLLLGFLLSTWILKNDPQQLSNTQVLNKATKENSVIWDYLNKIIGKNQINSQKSSSNTHTS